MAGDDADNMQRPANESETARSSVERTPVRDGTPNGARANIGEVSGDRDVDPELDGQGDAQEPDGTDGTNGGGI